MREFSLFFAPNINSCKRYQPIVRADALRWGTDNRTCALQLRWGTGRGCGWRGQVPGADVSVPGDRRARCRRGARHRRRAGAGRRCAGNAYDDRTRAGAHDVA
ncbi:hypothetical protein V2I01_23095 [Micromonospora sp. BRA006-A]|nr:hypothetical protein [Micromonospora sp. BRA006-A]